jgi:protocatechuate 3,4-dioxygenase beta subunit
MKRRHFLASAPVLAASARALFAECKPTSKDIIGPYYQAGAPMRTQVAQRSEPGMKLLVRGSVSDCSGPAAGALVEVWQATHDGCYSINQECGVLPGTPDKFRLRGKFLVDQSGAYLFRTIKPGQYDIGGGKFRPSHIHYKITLADDKGAAGTELITQLYFKGDKYNEIDESSRTPEGRARTIDLQIDEKSNSAAGRFDIVLPAAAAAGKRAALEGMNSADGDFLVHRLDGKLLFTVPGDLAGAGRVEIYSPEGARIERLALRQHQALWNPKVPRGVYLARVFLDDAGLEHAAHLAI